MDAQGVIDKILADAQAKADKINADAAKVQAEQQS